MHEYLLCRDTFHDIVSIMLRVSQQAFCLTPNFTIELGSINLRSVRTTPVFTVNGKTSELHHICCVWGIVRVVEMTHKLVTTRGRTTYIHMHINEHTCTTSIPASRGHISNLGTMNHSTHDQYPPPPLSLLSRCSVERCAFTKPSRMK